VGDPKKQRKKYEPPRFPWRTDVLQAELRLLGQYGLRNKKELWRHKTMLSKLRGIARSILGMPEKEGKKLKTQLLNRLNRLGILPETAALDDVLDLAIEDILERRLQSLVFRKGLVKSVYQARQLITHGHISIEGKKVTSPSYLVLRDEETHIDYAPSSTISNADHPLRQTLSSPPSQSEAAEKAAKEEAK
jgi:small subunit ribosomal protein S4